MNERQQRRRGARQPLNADILRAVRGATVAALLATTALTTTASAQPQGTDEQARASAREIGKQAVADYNGERYQAALDGFTRAHKLVNLSTTGLWRARSLVQLGRLVEASEQYLEIRRMTLDDSASATHRQAQQDAIKEREELLPRIPRLIIDVGGPLPADVVVTLDGANVADALVGAPQLVDPGKHVVVLKRGEAIERHELTLAEKQEERLKVKLPAKAVEVPKPTPKPLPEPVVTSTGGGALGTVGWVVGGVGAAAMIAGGVAGVMALDSNSTLEENCPGGNCPPGFHDDVDDFDAERLASNIGFIAGGVLLATGVTFIIIDAASSGGGEGEDAGTTAKAPVLQPTTLNVRVGPTGVSLVGRF